MIKSSQDLTNYYKQHLKYERQMLEFTYRMLFETGGKRWCAMFESFGIHARNLHEFLRHSEKHNSIHAGHYAPSHSKPSHSEIKNKMNASFFHLSTSRLENEPVNINDAAEIGKWIDREWANWSKEVSEPFVELIDASPVCSQPQTKPGSSATATNSTESTTSVILLGDKTEI